MANTYTQLYVHSTFAVKYRQAMLHHSWRSRLHQYICGIVTHQKNKVLAINSVDDHVHILLSMRPDQSLSDLMEKVKGDSSGWINDHHFTPRHFNWQRGFGGFSVSKSGVHNVVQYILNQEEHHKKKTFREEYLELLREYEIDFNEAYIFKDPE
jgi:REP element-mobilizing transposase RayT